MEAPVYAVSKAGTSISARCLVRAEAKNGIRAYCIAPGFVETAMTHEGMETRAAQITADIPLGQIALVEDVAGVAVFFASDAADYLTSVTIPLTGGSWFTT